MADAGMIKATIYVPEDLWRQFRAFCIQHGTSASQVLRDAMEYTLQLKDVPLMADERDTMAALLAKRTRKDV